MPCTEEVAVFPRLLAHRGRNEGAFIVMDTAPAGHTLRLLARQVPVTARGRRTWDRFNAG
ncbi:ArsA-related P-loop ATPase [Tabrizicola sp. YIM 78059]|uniref:ArsA-related P-loop ATPase n=1 Tax=Tabrizicola sp. YIM 78059 TaxID=2529861 RepID=UPI0010AAC1EE